MKDNKWIFGWLSIPVYLGGVVFAGYAGSHHLPFINSIAAAVGFMVFGVILMKLGGGGNTIIGDEKEANPMKRYGPIGAFFLIFTSVIYALYRYVFPL